MRMTQRLPGSVPKGWRKKRGVYKARKSRGGTGLEGTRGFEECVGHPSGVQAVSNIMPWEEEEERGEEGRACWSNPEHKEGEPFKIAVRSARCGQKIKEEG